MQNEAKFWERAACPMPTYRLGHLTGRGSGGEARPGCSTEGSLLQPCSAKGCPRTSVPCPASRRCLAMPRRGLRESGVWCGAPAACPGAAQQWVLSSLGLLMLPGPDQMLPSAGHLLVTHRMCVSPWGVTFPKVSDVAYSYAGFSLPLLCS